MAAVKALRGGLRSTVCRTLVEPRRTSSNTMALPTTVPTPRLRIAMASRLSGTNAPMPTT